MKNATVAHLLKYLRASHNNVQNSAETSLPLIKNIREESLDRMTDIITELKRRIKE